MTPESAIANVRDLTRRIDAVRARLSAEADEINEQWGALRGVGGQRADHAAVLLQRLRPHLAELTRFASACVEQLDAYKADPFGRKETA